MHPSYEHLIANNDVLPEQSNSISQQEEKKEEQQQPQETQRSRQEEFAQQANALQEEKPSMELDEIANVSLHFLPGCPSSYDTGLVQQTRRRWFDSRHH